MDNITQYYAVLSIGSSASLETVKQAYRELAKIWHPDKYASDCKLKSQAEAEMKKINQAYNAIESYLELENNILDKSDNDLRSQVGISRNTSDFYYSQGVHDAEQENFSDALRSFGLAIKLDPEYTKAYQYRGFILSKLGYENRAEAEFARVNRIRVKKQTKASPSNPSNQTATYDKKRTSVEHDKVEQKKRKKKKTSPSNSSQQTDTFDKNSIRNNVKKQVIKCRETIVTANQPITSIAIASNNFLFAYINSDRQIELRDINTGQIVATLQGHTDVVKSLIVDSTGTALVSSGEDKTIRFWDLKAKKIVKTFGGYFNGHSEAILALALSPDNKLLLSYGADNIINTWDIERAQVIRSTSVSRDLTCLEISPNCQIFATADLESQVEIRAIADGKVIGSINNSSGISSLAFSPDSNVIATGRDDCLIRLWDIKTGNIIQTLAGHLE